VFEFRMLGALTLHGAHGRELRGLLAQPKRMALLAFLGAATPHGFHRRDSLLALFWPKLDSNHARAALRQALHGLRRSLGDDAIESRGDQEVRLDERFVRCDVTAFDEAISTGCVERALELYRGDLLEGFFISHAPAFERWLEDERAQRRRAAAMASLQLAESCHVACEDLLSAHWARRAASLSADDECVLRRLISLLDRLGDRAGAVHAYTSFARRLAEDVEAEPAIETQSLIAAVRARTHTATA
jgi:DNA-binding SARP family transcriptional activator